MTKRHDARRDYFSKDEIMDLKDKVESKKARRSQAQATKGGKKGK